MTLPLAQLRQRLQTSLWTLPAVAVVLALGGVQALTEVDRRLGPKADRWYLFAGQAESARELLSTIATSMLTFTALVFSITILVLQLASSQFSPRVIGTFLRDRRTQMTLAVFVGAFVYAMALLPEVRAESEEGHGFVPALAIFVAFVLVLVSVAVFIQYVHHMAHAIRAVEVIRRVGDDTRRSLEHLYPEEVLEEPPAGRAPEGPPDGVLVLEGHAGVLSHVDAEGLLEVACEQEVVIALVPRMGDFVPRGAPLFRVWGTARLEASRLRPLVGIAAERTHLQDPAFGFRQLVDIAERALSPGINDPTTAVQAIDQLHDLLRLLAVRRFPSQVRADEEGRVRLVLPAPDWDSYVRLAVDEIRQYGAGSLQVMRRLRALLEDLLKVAPEERRAVLEAQRTLLDRATLRGFHTGEERRMAERPSMQGHGALSDGLHS